MNPWTSPKKVLRTSLSGALSHNYDNHNICILVELLTHILCKGKKTAEKGHNSKKDDFPHFTQKSRNNL
jgi:hypothetical protein